MRSLLLTIMVLFTGCTVSVPPVSEYRIDAGESEISFKQMSCSDKSLRVSQVFSSSSLMSKKMQYAHGNYKQNNYSESQWAQSPSRALTSEILKSVRSSELFSSVLSYKTRSRSHYLLESSVEDFMQYFSEDEKSSYVRVAIVMSLVESRSGKVVSSQRFLIKKETKSADAKGGVEALNAALKELLAESNKWLSRACK